MNPCSTTPSSVARRVATALALTLALAATAAAQSSTQLPGLPAAPPRQPFTPPPAAPTLYQYDLAGRLTQVVYPDGTTQTYTYDTRSNVVGISVAPPPDPSAGAPGAAAETVAPRPTPSRVEALRGHQQGPWRAPSGEPLVVRPWSSRLLPPSGQLPPPIPR